MTQKQRHKYTSLHWKRRETSAPAGTAREPLSTGIFSIGCESEMFF